MTYELELEPREIKIKPASKVEEILQNVRTLLLTMLGSVPMYREFGIDADLTDLPVNVAQVRFTSKVAAAINRWEPRARLKKVRWQQSLITDGQLIPVLTLEL